jgi:uncharacterized protein YjiS (DUF1127 family)
MPFPTFPAPYGRIPPSRLRRFDGCATDPASSPAGLRHPTAGPLRAGAALRILADAWRRLIAGARRWQRRRAMYGALYELNDHMLRDLGIDRSEITSVCAEIAGDAPATRIHTLGARMGEPY